MLVYLTQEQRKGSQRGKKKADHTDLGLRESKMFIKMFTKHKHYFKKKSADHLPLKNDYSLIRRMMKNRPQPLEKSKDLE